MVITVLFVTIFSFIRHIFSSKVGFNYYSTSSFSSNFFHHFCMFYPRRVCLLLILFQVVHGDDVVGTHNDAVAEASAQSSTADNSNDERPKRQSNYQYVPFELPNNNFVSFAFFCIFVQQC